MKKQDITKYMDRYIGKKVDHYLVQNNYNNIKLYDLISDAIRKTLAQKLNYYDISIGFRNTVNKRNLNKTIFIIL